LEESQKLYLMSAITLESLHNCLKLLENTSELKRRLPASANPKSLKEGLHETSRLIGVDGGLFKDVQTISALIGSQRFVMIWGEPSATDHVARAFDNARVLLAGLLLVASPRNGVTVAGPKDNGPQQGGAMAALAPGWTSTKAEVPTAPPQPRAERELSPNSLNTLLTGNVPLTCRLFRSIFEHLLGFAFQSTGPQGSASLVNDLAGSKEHGRAFLSTALFILGAEIDRDNLMSFMMRQGLFGMSVFEHLLQNRDYCEAFHSFRHLERAFMGPPAAEETHLRGRLDQFNAQFGGKPYGAKIFEADEQDKAKIDAYLAAADLLEALALTPWCMALNKAVSLAGSNSIRSAAIIASQFERFGRGEATKDRANQEIGDHLLAFARQFSADTKPA
jgi:hypothetical protein